MSQLQPLRLPRPEFAILGRSNVGKSSLINALEVALTSKKPDERGRTGDDISIFRKTKPSNCMESNNLNTPTYNTSLSTNNTNLSRKRERYPNLSPLFCPQRREQAINNLVQLQAKRDADRKFPPGIRFRPTDLELIQFYLYFKIKDNHVPWWNRITEVELYNHSPEFLAEQFPQYGNNERYFFTSRERKYPNGSRPKRTTNNGYWKATGVDKEIRENGILKGLKKTLVFYKGEPQHGDKTKWIMHEYKLVDAPIPTTRSPNDMKLDDCVLCKIYSANNRRSSEQDEDHPEVVSDINPTTQLPQVLNTEIISPGLSLQGREAIMNDLCKLEKEQLKEQNPPGFRFYPTDRELVKYYLKPRVLNKPLPELSFMEVDLYNQNPDTLAEQNIDYGEKIWYFFTPRNRKYQNGSRPNRAAGDGYWKANGADVQIKEKGVIIGFKKTLNFMRGKPPKGEKTGWIMHEYKINAPAPTKRSENDMRLDDCVLCRIYNKKERIRNEDEDHSKDASSISLPEDDRRELMENFKGAGQDYENLSNNNVPAPLANSMASFPYQFQAMDGNYGTYNMASFPNQFQAMDGNFGAYNVASVPNQFVGQPMYFQSSYPRETPFSESAMVGNHGSLPQKIDQPIYFSPPEACELVGNNGTPHWMNSPFSPAELSGYQNDNTSNPALQLDFYNNHPPPLLQTNDNIPNKHQKLSDDHTSMYKIWTIWYRKNKVRTAPPGFPLNLIVQRAYEALLEYRTAQARHTMAAPTARQRARWSPPPPDWFKANFDAAIFEDVVRAGLRVIIRDSQGLAMAALAQNVQLASSVVEMEALAATRAVELAAEIGLDRIIVEGDTSIVIRGLTDQVPNFAPFGFLIKEAYDLANQLNHVKFQHVGREGNKVAHNLARHA